MSNIAKVLLFYPLAIRIVFFPTVRYSILLEMNSRGY